MENAQERVTAWVAGPDEAEAVARLLVAFRDHHGRDHPSANAFLAGVERLMDNLETEFLLAAPDDDSPPGGVAQVRFRFSVWTAAPDAWLEDVFVTEEARRAGVATALVELAVERARERGCRRIELDTSADNAAAQALYARQGFGSKSADAATLLLSRRLAEG